MGDDIGIWNIGAYHRGMMAGRDAQPRQARSRRHAVHRLLRRSELHGGARQLHHRRTADPHRPDDCRAGRRHHRHAGRRRRPSPPRSNRWATRPASSARTTSATATSSCRRVHGFDEFFGYLYHLDAMEDPSIPTIRRICRTRSARATCCTQWATDTDDPDRHPRWGKIGKQKIIDEGPLPPHPIDGIKYNMETVDEVIRDKDDRVHRQGQVPPASRSSCG